MSWFFSSKVEDPKEKRFNNIVESIQKAEIKEIPALYNELNEFIPEKSEKIVSSLLNNMVAVLARPAVSKEVPLSIANLVYSVALHVPKESWPSPLLDQFINHPRFLPSLFAQAGTNESRVYDILDLFYDYNPDKMNEFIGRSPLSLSPLIKSMSSQHNDRSASIFLRVIKNNPEKIAPLSSLINSNISKIPSNVVAALITTVPEFKGARYEPLIRNILNNDNNENLSISDVRNMLQSFPKFLTNEDLVKTLLSATKSDSSLSNEAELSWIHNIEPKKFSVSRSLADRCEEQLNKCTDTKLAFLYLYAASFINPGDISAECVIRHCFNSDNFVSAAGLQVLCIWLTKSGDTNVPLRVTYLAAAHILDQNVPKEVRILSKALLRLLCDKYKIASYISSNDVTLQYDSSENAMLRIEKWEFPNFIDCLKSVEPLQYVDCSESVEVLGHVVNLLNLVE